MPLIDRYLIKQLVPAWIFCLSLCTILGEVIGISFEQVDFIVEQNFSLATALQVHWLKLPAFLSLALPFSLLMANGVVYSKLSKNNEIIAFQSFGVRIYRLILTPVFFGILILSFKFFLDISIVPSTNYQAAIVIENEFKIERNNLQKYHSKNIVYQDFSTLDRQQLLKYIICVDSFDGEKLHDINILEFKQRQLYKIVIAGTAIWNQQLELWDLNNGSQHIINNHEYEEVNYFDRLSLSIGKNLLYYVQNYRDNREMTLGELHQWLKVLKGGNNLKKIRQLQIDIQERYALPFSCIVFTLLGLALGCSRQIEIKKISLILLIIFGYQATQFLSNSLCLIGLIPVTFGVWIPNIITLILSTILLNSNT